MPADYGIYPHLDQVEYLDGDTDEVEAFSLWGNDYFDDRYLHNGKPTQYKGYCTDVWFRQGLRFVQENADKPFFLYFCTSDPHRGGGDAEELPYKPNRFGNPAPGNNVR